jgi:hypothetical protein
MSSATDLWLLDLAGIRFSWSRTSRCLSVYSSRLEVLAVVRLDGSLSTEETALRGLDEVLKVGRVERVLTHGREVYPVGLYNPFTAEVAVGGVPGTRTFSDRKVLDIDDDGALAAVIGSEMVVGDRVLSLIPVSPAGITRAKTAHEDAVPAR